MTGTARDNGNKVSAMARTRRTTASYFPDGDVLYIDAGPSQHSFCDPGEDGLLRRYGIEDGLPSGVTVVGFDQVWATRRTELCEKVAVFLGVAVVDVESAVTQGTPAVC